MIVTGVIGSNLSPNPARAGNSGEIFDIHSYELDYTASGDSMEYMFDASGKDYLAFADAVVALAHAHSPVFGYMGIRFTPKATALLVLQRYGLTAAVEVTTARTRTDPVYAEFLAAVHDAAHNLGGIPHWGQEFVPSARRVSNLYQEALPRWQGVLAEIAAEDHAVFSTAFTRSVGLEPNESGGILIMDPLTAFLTALRGGEEP